MNRYMTSTVVMDIQRPIAPPPSDIIPPSNPQPLPTPTPESPSPKPPEVKKPGRRKGPIIAIVLTIVVVLGLIAGAVFFYLQSRGKTEEPVAQTPVEAPLLDDGQVDPEDIDVVVQKIDGSLTNLNDSADFGADDLNDSTLGL